MDRVDALITLLLDPAVDSGTQDDAAMDLGSYDDDRALHALITAALDPNTDDEIVRDSCAESIGEILVKRDQLELDINLYQRMPDRARSLIYYYIKGHKPEWVEKYNIKI